MPTPRTIEALTNQGVPEKDWPVVSNLLSRPDVQQAACGPQFDNKEDKEQHQELLQRVLDSTPDATSDLLGDALAVRREIMRDRLTK